MVAAAATTLSNKPVVSHFFLFLAVSALSLSLSVHGGVGRERDSATFARSGGSEGAPILARLRCAGRWLTLLSSSLPVPPACRGGEGRWRRAKRLGERTLILKRGCCLCFSGIQREDLAHQAGRGGEVVVKGGPVVTGASSGIWELMVI
jgi:hypothetical protein